MSELEVKRSEAKDAIAKLLQNTANDNNYASIHEVNVLALGLADTLLEHNAKVASMTLTRGRGNAKIRQRYYEIKISDLRVAMGDILDDVTPPEDKIVDEVLPSYLTDLDEDTYPSEEEDNA